jgi:ribosomal protein S14
MATFLTTKSIAGEIDRLIRTADSRITLISPYLQVSEQFLDRLRSADRRGVQLRLVYGKNELKGEEKAKLCELKKVALYYSKDLHAKCFSNERSVIISTMNLYEYSELNNREMGVLLTDADADATREARAEIEEIVATATREPLGQFRVALSKLFRGAEQPKPSKATTPSGHCIRCGAGGRYTPQSPLCGPCYRSWAEWQNENYAERFCHRCGEDADVTKAKPLCYTCFREAPVAAASL